MSIYTYIIVMAMVTVGVRVLPLTLIRKPIKNQFIKSFLYYVPYVTLAVMTFPTILEVCPNNPLPGAAALIAGLICAWAGLGLFPVSIICCVMVLLLQFIA